MGGRVRWVLIATLAVAACTAAPVPSGSGAAGASSEVTLDCVRDSYPCSNADVDPAVWRRSTELGTEAATRLGGGATTADVAAWLLSQDKVAVVEHDDQALRFRLVGGRFTWVAHDPDGPSAAHDAPDAARVGGTPVQPGRVQLASIVRSVVGTGETDKSATVIAPMAYRKGSLGASEIATVLGQTRGYEGHVNFVEQGSREAGTALPAMSALDGGYDVVFIRTYGGSVCLAAEGGAIPCHSWIAMSEMLGDGFKVADGQNGAYEIVIYSSGFRLLAAGPDFFRTRYPGGLQHAMIVLDAQNQKDQALIGAIKGGSSELFAWDGPALSEQSGPAVEAFIGDLSHTGRTGQVVFDEHKLELVSGDASLFRVAPATGGSLRIRDIVSLRHPDTKDPLTTGAEINVAGTLGDGKPDKVHFIVDLDGITEAESAQTIVTVTIAGVDAAPLSPADGGEILDASTWRLQGDVELLDLTEGQELDISAKALLPEGGQSQQEVVVKVAQLLGSEYLGEFTVVGETLLPGVTRRISATVTFVREPSEPGATKFTFVPTAGDFHWEYGGTSGTCTYLADPANLSIEPDHGELRFDFSRKAEGIVTYWGHADRPNGPEVKLSVDCADHDTTTTTRAGGVYFLAPQEEAFLFSGGTITGSYSSGATVGTTFTWTFTKVR